MKEIRWKNIENPFLSLWKEVLFADNATGPSSPCRLSSSWLIHRLNVLSLSLTIVFCFVLFFYCLQFSPWKILVTICCQTSCLYSWSISLFVFFLNSTCTLIHPNIILIFFVSIFPIYFRLSLWLSIFCRHR